MLELPEKLLKDISVSTDDVPTGFQTFEWMEIPDEVWEPLIEEE